MESKQEYQELRDTLDRLYELIRDPDTPLKDIASLAKTALAYERFFSGRDVGSPPALGGGREVSLRFLATPTHV